MARSNSFFWLLLFAIILLLPGIAELPVVDRDEAHFAQATRQMLESKNYFQIRFQTITRFQKPPGINWLQAISVNAFSNAKSTAIWPYRLPSFFGALFAVLATFLLAKRFTSERIATMAAVLLASSFLLVFEAHLAVIDASLLFSVVLMESALCVIFCNACAQQQVSKGWAILFWLAMSWGMLLKGVTPLVGGLSIAFLCLIEKNRAWLRQLHCFFGLLLLTGLTLAWLLPVNQAEESNYLLQMFNRDLLPKLQGGHESHGKPPLFHLIILPFTFWPASLFLWQGVAYVRKNYQQPFIKLLMAWIVPTWLFFECMPTKLPQYVLPTFPAIAICCALGIQAFKPPASKRALKILQMGWGGFSVLLALGFLSLPFVLLHTVTLAAISLFVLVSGLSILAVYWVTQQALTKAIWTIALMALLSYPLLYSRLLPKIEPLWMPLQLYKQLKTQNLQRAPLIVVGYTEPSLVFYLQTKGVLFASLGELAILLNQNPSSFLLVNAHDQPAIGEKFKNLGYITAVEGYDYNYGRWIQLALFKQEKQRASI